jgi:Mlc titration factor MtfA (ptsG expression regulator)
MFDFFKSRRRGAIRERPFPDAWRAFIEDNVPYVATLSAEDRRELEGHVQVFLAEKKFEGCGGLVLTDEMRVTIAAQACLLLLHRETDYFPDLEVVLVYPHAYKAEKRERAGVGATVETEDARLGESSPGVVVLAWDAVRRGAADANDGHNVTLHEFAHQLDQEDGDADGAPVLEKRVLYTAWAQVLGAEFTQLVDDVERHRRNDIRAYGATNPAEFFAVVTETFFEKPRQLKARHPELYAQLVTFYKQDPASRPRT